MTKYVLYQGGNKANNGTNRMYPSGTNPAACNPSYSYADHQRSRDYAVTRTVDFRASTPYGGGGRDRALVDMFKDIVVTVGDEFETHLLLPNTVFKAVSMGIVSPLAGFAFELRTRNDNVLLVNTVNAAIVPRNAAGCAMALYKEVPDGPYGAAFLVDDEDAVILKVTAAPAGGKLSNTSLALWITAHVMDLNNGNNTNDRSTALAAPDVVPT